MTSILDPDLHTRNWVRNRSPFLFSAIITVATKVAHPLHYVPALRYCKKLLGGAFEEGHNSVEFVQALAILVFWGDATDESYVTTRSDAWSVRETHRWIDLQRSSQDGVRDSVGHGSRHARAAQATATTRRARGEGSPGRCKRHCFSASRC